MALTDVKVRNAKPKEKPYKLFDGDGLYLLIPPNGKKGWRFKYRIEGKEKLLSFGTYPEVSLLEAREKRLDARKLISSGINPSETRKAAKASATENHNSFESIAREWHKKFSHTWSDSHSHRNLRRLECVFR